MNDTPEHVQRLYHEFFQRKTEAERFLIGIEMMEDGRRMVETALRQQHPDWSEHEMKIGMFTRIYGRDFTPEQVADIIASLG